MSKLKFRDGKWYNPKENADWAYEENGQRKIVTLRKGDKLLYSSSFDRLIFVGGASIKNASNHIDKFEPYMDSEEVEMYERTQRHSAIIAMQAILSNPNLVDNIMFLEKQKLARTACQIASTLVREMIEEEYYDEVAE